MGFLSKVVGSITGANSAARAQRRATDKQMEEARRQFDLNRADLEPFRAIGLENFQRLNQLSNDPSMTPEGRLERIRATFQNSPGYQNRLANGVDQIEQSAAAQGSLFSGNTLKGMERFRQDLAQNEFNNYANMYNNASDSYMNRIASLANVGQTTTNNLVNQRNNLSNSLQQGYGNIGAIKAAHATSGWNTLMDVANLAVGAKKARMF